MVSDMNMGFQEFEQKYSHLLSWEDAEKKAGRRLDWNNNLDCSLYHDLLVEVVNARQMETSEVDRDSELNIEI